ncbi:hypothetical protein SCFA_2170003 [anaerobic digester metagenome]|uniref:Uncharacterized protein n=1 Tax=anaerobic digester metagenome TaxID=1263854 RepID=A0A485LYM3_9ZZZZ
MSRCNFFIRKPAAFNRLDQIIRTGRFYPNLIIQLAEVMSNLAAITNYTGSDRINKGFRQKR